MPASGPFSNVSHMAVPKKDPEVEAIGKLAEALDGLDTEQQARTIRWAAERYGVGLSGKSRGAGGGDGGGGNGDGRGSDPCAYDDVGDLVVAAAPSTDEDRALVVAYWLQELWEKKQPTFTGMDVNKELKNLGHGSNNITGLIERLLVTSPQQVLQTKKTGTQRQGRKSYKVTKAGAKRVQELLDAS